MNTASSWNNSTGFGSTNTQPGSNSSQGNTSLFGAPAQTNQPSGLFGNSNSSNAASGGLFGAGSNPSGGGLFGNSTAAKATASFPGASNTTNPQNTSSANGGLFGNSATSTNLGASSNGGLFGNSAKRAVSEGPTTGGLFNTTPAASNPLSTSSAAQSSTSTGLFGSSNGSGPSSGGLFGSNNTGQASTSSGLLGNNNNKSTGLFGNSSNTQSSGFFGNSSNTQSSGLFGNSNNNNTQSSGLFGSSAPSGGLFGNSNTSTGLSGNQPSTSGSLFGNSSQNVNPSPAASSNVYGSDSIFSTMQIAEATMPSSITSSLFGSTPNTTIKNLKAAAPDTKFKNSLLGKLAQTFNIFRPSNNQTKVNNSLKGVFTQSNYVNSIPVAQTSKFKVQKQTGRLPSRKLGSVNKLVIKSKPSKFHLIDADKVFKAKQSKVLTSANDDDLSETESIENDPIPAPITDEGLKSATKMNGHGLQSEDILNRDRTDDPEHNNGYFCYPSLKELAQFSPAQLKQVPDFIVGRIGHGQVAYNFPVDLSNIFESFSYDTGLIAEEMFGKLFILNSPYVIVYDERYYKSPPQFKELNMPATVTIKAPPKNRPLEDHIRALKNLEGQEFVTYDPITYNWISQVEHFSVWGLLDDDEVEGDEAEELNRLREMKKKQNEREHEISRSNLYENESYHNELKRQKIQRQTSGIPGGWEFDTTIKADSGSLLVKQGLVRNEINQEVSQFKTDKSAIYIATNASDITSDSEEEPVDRDGSAMDGLLFPNEVRNYDYIKEFVHAAPTNLEIDNIIDEKAFEPELDDEKAFNLFDKTSSFPTSKNWLLQLELANEISSALAPELSRPRKTQSALNTVNDILFGDLPANLDSSYQASTPKKETLEPKLLLDDASTRAIDVLSKFTHDILKMSSISSRQNGFPILEIDDKLTFKTVSALFNDTTDGHYFDLSAILFDQPDLKAFAKYRDLDYSNLHLVKRLECIEERQAFAGWLRIYNKQAYEDLPQSEDPLDQIFCKVCSGDLKPAIELAIQSHNSHLAPLLTLMDSNDATVRSIADGQLNSWKTTGFLDFIPGPLLKVHRILAGDLGSFMGNLPDYICLGLELFYGNPAESVSSVVTRIGEKLNLVNELGSILRIHAAIKSMSFSDACEILVQSSLSPKLKWIIYQILSNKEPNCSNPTAQNAVATLFGKELELCGLWKEALYVYSSMASDEDSKKAIRSAVINSVDHFEGQKEQNFLMEVLRIPKELIFEAISLKKRKKEDFWGCGEALVLAGMWDEAHDLICEKLAPLAVIEEGSYMKSVVRALITSFPEDGRLIASWNQGAGLFSKYLLVTEQYDNGEDVDLSDIDYLLDNLALVQENPIYLVNVATQIMARKVGDIALECQNKFPQAKEKISNLSLSENEKTYFASRLQ